MADKTNMIGEIVGVMRNHWDFPADCNDGELFTYAEILFDRMSAGEDREELFSYLANVQVEKLKMPMSEVYRDIARRSIALVRNPCSFSKAQNNARFLADDCATRRAALDKP
jgi:hypothetical protein